MCVCEVIKNFILQPIILVINNTFIHQDYLRIRQSVPDRDSIWPILCSLDSDGDGRSNGDELGDSMCVWRLGMESPSDRILYHPGKADLCLNSNKDILYKIHVLCKELPFSLLCLLRLDQHFNY